MISRIAAKYNWPALLFLLSFTAIFIFAVIRLKFAAIEVLLPLLLFGGGIWLLLGFTLFAKEKK